MQDKYDLLTDVYICDEYRYDNYLPSIRIIIMERRQTDFYIDQWMMKTSSPHLLLNTVYMY